MGDTRAVRSWMVSVAGAGAWMVLAWTLRARTLHDLDSANFLHALARYDLALHMPHFPGYPVYIALARFAHGLTGDPIAALTLPGIFACGVGGCLLFHALRRWLGPVAAGVGVLATGLAPLFLLTSGQPTSDATAIGLVIATGSLTALAWPRPEDADPMPDTRATRLLGAAGLILGLALGVRLSYAPLIVTLALVMFAHRRGRGSAVAFALLVGVLLWLVPMAVLVGPSLVEFGATFLRGHFGHWGGTIAVTGDPLARIGAWTYAFGVHGLALPTAPGEVLRAVVFTTLVALAIAGFATLPARHRIALLVLASPYALWLWLCQNPEKPRHVLPLVPVVGVLVAVGSARVRELVAQATHVALNGASVIAIALLFCVSVPLGVTQARSPSPEAQLAAYVAAHYPLAGTQVFCGSSERVLGVYAPGLRAEYAPDMQEVHRRLRHIGRPPVLLITDEVAGVGGTRVATFQRDPRVDAHRPAITLYEGPTAP